MQFKPLFIMIGCAMCSKVNGLPLDFPAKDALSIPELLLFYSGCGITYTVISSILEQYHGLKLSANAICKSLKRYGQQSRRGPTSLDSSRLGSLIKGKLESLSRTVGYRQLTEILKHEGYHVRRDDVMKNLRQVDPLGVQFLLRRRLQRRTYSSMGPNHTWHVDGYDKLKPYGFPIHGCIDGYSRKILWLQICPSNNDPKKVTYYYMLTVKRMKCCPILVQADKETENTVIGALQCVFRRNSEEMGREGDSFQHISSQLNQRIEAWWSFFRKRMAQWWMDFFRDLVSSGLFESHKESSVRCMRYCFAPLIQRDLDNVVEQWNSHQISKSRNGPCPNGVPHVLFSEPSLSGGRECLQNLTDEDVSFGFSQTIESTISGNYEFDKMAEECFQCHRSLVPETWK